MKGFNFLISIIISLIVVILGNSCTGSKRYFKAAEKLEKQGLVNEAAEFYLESLKRNYKNTDARIKLKEVGQKYLDFLSSQFFREFTTGEYESSIQTFEKILDFKDRAGALGVELSYPTAYKEDYQTAIDYYVENNYNKGLAIFKQKKYKEALPYFEKVKKYRPEYKKLQTYYITAHCEPLYQNLLIDVQNKNYSKALQTIQQIYKITNQYKDVKEIEELCNGYLQKNILLFKPNLSNPNIRLNLDKELTMQVINGLTIGSNSNFINIKEDNTFGVFYLDAIENNPDLLRAIAKATNSDYFLAVYANNRKISSPAPQIKKLDAYQEFITKVGETYVKEYKAVPYNNVKVSKSFGFDLNYKIIQTQNLQTIVSQYLPIQATEQKEYNEFIYKPTADIRNFYPYNPATTPPFSQYNPKPWRDLFFVNKQLKSNEELQQDAIQQALQQIQKSITSLE
ncbi:MAG: hypothetical protein KatS3mg027_0061 [Bacteroidia bacterium]|nr:MAG: hypothetical protein KatS3mg027_0061 [Bacteroidia bacterium]